MPAVTTLTATLTFWLVWFIFIPTTLVLSTQKGRIMKCHDWICRVRFSDSLMLGIPYQYLNSLSTSALKRSLSKYSLQIGKVHWLMKGLFRFPAKCSQNRSVQSKNMLQKVNIKHNLMSRLCCMKINAKIFKIWLPHVRLNCSYSSPPCSWQRTSQTWSWRLFQFHRNCDVRSYNSCSHFIILFGIHCYSYKCYFNTKRGPILKWEQVRVIRSIDSHQLVLSILVWL